MGATRADRWIWAVVVAAGAVMAMCFALRSAAADFPAQLPYEPPAAVQEAEEGLVNINTAGLEELMTLYGIGQVKAQAILDDREANGPFRCPEDLIRVKGIGEGTLSNILERITTGG